ncbi:hypothetical protein HYR99_10495 [Candidatus Poribacteria bacterium]|nr:hypothetical protein [Candidatus Poribacteria bacterium]
MQESKEHVHSETIDETMNFRSQVREEIGSLREKVDHLLEMIEEEYSFNPHSMLRKVRRFPVHLKEPIRWGFIGGIRGSAQCSIYTKEMDEFFKEPNGSLENVAEFAQFFINLRTVDVCRHAFQGKQTKTELMEACGLTDEELEAAVQPILDWGIAEWKAQDDEQKLCGIGHGFALIVTMIALTKTAVNENKNRKSKNE